MNATATRKRKARKPSRNGTVPKPAELLPGVTLMRLEVFAAAMWPEVVNGFDQEFLKVPWLDVDDDDVVASHVMRNGQTERTEIGRIPDGLKWLNVEGIEPLDSIYVGTREAIAELAQAHKAHLDAWGAVHGKLHGSAEAKGGAK